MAHITINQYLQQVYEAIDTRDGASLAELVSFKHPHVANPRLQMASPEEKCQQVLEPPYDEMFAAHLRCTYAVGNHDFIEAYKCQTVIVQSFLRAFQAHKEENWALPVMYAVALDLRIFANNHQLVREQQSLALGSAHPFTGSEAVSDTRLWTGGRSHVPPRPAAGDPTASGALRGGTRGTGSSLPVLLVSWASWIRAQRATSRMAFHTRHLRQNPGARARAETDISTKEWETPNSLERKPQNQDNLHRDPQGRPKLLPERLPV